MRNSATSLAVLLVLSPAALAEMASVQLADRRVVIADVRLSPQQVGLHIGQQSLTLPRAQVRQVIWHHQNQAEYDRRAVALRDDDLEGHLELADWCTEKLRYDLARAECEHILQRDSAHANAGVLRDFITIRLVTDLDALAPLAAPGKPGEGDRPAAGATAPRTGEALPPVDDALIQRIRLAELRDDIRDEPQNLKVTLTTDMAKRMWERIEALRGEEDKAGRSRFIRKKPLEKLYTIIDEGLLEEFADQVRITTDPQVFREFRQFALPMIMNNCGSTSCHGGLEATPFRLRDAKTTEALYTNFLLLDQLTVKRESAEGELEYRLIDRDQPDDSLLLRYMLPSEEDPPEFRHTGEIKLKHGMRARTAKPYLRLEDWIKSLRWPHPGYGLAGEQEEEAQPAESQD